MHIHKFRKTKYTFEYKHWPNLPCNARILIKLKVLNLDIRLNHFFLRKFLQCCKTMQQPFAKKYFCLFNFIIFEIPNICLAGSSRLFFTWCYFPLFLNIADMSALVPNYCTAETCFTVTLLIWLEYWTSL